MPLWLNCFPCTFSKVPLTIHHFSMVPYFEGVGLGFFHSFLREFISICIFHFPLKKDFFIYKRIYRPSLLYHSILCGIMPGGHQSFLSGYIFSGVSSTTTLHSWIIPFSPYFQGGHFMSSFPFSSFRPCPSILFRRPVLGYLAKHSSPLSFHTLKRGCFFSLANFLSTCTHSSLRGLVSISFQRSLLPSLLCSCKTKPFDHFSLLSERADLFIIISWKVLVASFIALPLHTVEKLIFDCHVKSSPTSFMGVTLSISLQMLFCHHSSLVSSKPDFLHIIEIILNFETMAKYTSTVLKQEGKPPLPSFIALSYYLLGECYWTIHSSLTEGEQASLLQSMEQ